jgi:predicted HTH transcriptional regulator
MGNLDQITPSDKSIQEFLNEGKTIFQDFIFSSENSHHTVALISSLANTKGGILIVGVNSKGKVVGVLPKEEEENIRFILQNFCTVNIQVFFTQQTHQNKFVLLVNVPKSENKIGALSIKATPHFFVRSFSGEVFEVNKIIEKSWLLANKKVAFDSELNSEENKIMLVLSSSRLTISQLYKLVEAKKSHIDTLLSGLIAKGFVCYEFDNMHVVYFLREEF